MWFKNYRDYPIDTSLIKEKVEPNRGIIGCEMHELNGWGIHKHQVFYRKRKIFEKLQLLQKSIARILLNFFRKLKNE